MTSELDAEKSSSGSPEEGTGGCAPALTSESAVAYAGSAIAPSAGRPPIGQDRGMKIRVQHDDGRTETLTLRGSVEVVEGKFMNRLTDGSGMDHYFLHDGSYDGWGGAISCDERTARDTIEAMEEKREMT
jgi:hypothetical protein